MEIPDKYVSVFNQIKNKEICYDTSEDESYYNINVNTFIKQRLRSRIYFFNNLKRKHKLYFTNEADELFHKFLDFCYYEKTLKYMYYMKKICDIFNIKNSLNIKEKKKYEEIWNSFLEEMKRNILKKYVTPE